MNDTPLKDRWYVDVRGTVSIMGTEEIIERLYSGELKAVHRISRNKQDWRAICNEPSFEKRLQQELKALSTETFGETPIVQRADLEEGSTTELGFDVNNVGDQITDQLSQAKKMQELGLALTNLRRVLADIAANKKLTLDGSNNSKEEDVLHLEDRDVYVKDATSLALEKKATKASVKRLLTVGAVFCLFALIINFGISYWMEKEEKRKAVVEKEKQKNQLAGKYAGALNNMNLSTKPKIAPADASVENPDDHFVERYHSALELMQKGDYQSAENLLLEALRYPQHDKLPVAMAIFETAWQLDRADMRTQKVEAATAASNGEQVSLAPPYQRVSATKDLLNRVGSPDHSMLGEFTLIKIVASLLLNDADSLPLSKAFIEQYPHDGPKDNLEQGLNYGRWTWYKICPWLIETMQVDRANAYLNAALASCMVRSDNHLGAKPYIEYANKKIPSDYSIEMLAGHIYLLSGDLEKAKAIIYKPGELQPSIILTKSKEWICTKNPMDEHCETRKPASVNKPVPKVSQKSPGQFARKPAEIKKAARRRP
jgi:TolA-binding protein